MNKINVRLKVLCLEEEITEANTPTTKTAPGSNSITMFSVAVITADYTININVLGCREYI
jgi:hypothetical protein